MGGSYEVYPSYELGGSLADREVVEVRSIQDYGNGDFLSSAQAMYNRGTTVWTAPTVTEMTMAEVNKALGKTIKIVEG